MRRASLVLAAILAALYFMAGRSAASPLGSPRPYLIARISHVVFGARWRTAACIAHFESTDGAHLYNGPNLGPWQINVAAHPWVDSRRVVFDWWYSARCAYRISSRGRDWSAWGTHSYCGV